MAKIGNAMHEMLALKKLVESKDPELLTRLSFSLFGNADVSNIYKMIATLYTDNGTMPGWDLIKAEFINRVNNPERLKFYTDLLNDVKDKDATGITTDDLIDKLKIQRQFRVVLDGADKLVNAVEKRDADLTIGLMRELYEDLFVQDNGMSMDKADMCNMAGKSVTYEFEKTGLTGLDKRGGLILGGLTGVAGESKAGKSLLAGQIAKYGYDEYDSSTYYHSFEQSPAEIRCRLLSSISEIDIGLVTSGLLTDAQRVQLRVAEVAHLCYLNDNMKDFCTVNRALSDAEFWPLFWAHFEPRNSRFYIPENMPDWDGLFVQMQMFADLKNVKRYVIDYPMIINRGAAHRDMASWEYNLMMSRKLKAFARENGVRVIIPMQFDSKADNIRYASGVINDVDLLLTMKQEDGDKEYGDMGAVTIGYKAFRNYLTIPTEPTLQPFKLLKQFNLAKFLNFDF